MDKVLAIGEKSNEKFLRRKAENFNVSSLKDKNTVREMRGVVRQMREAMCRMDGVGLSANQIGLPLRLFVARVPDSQGRMKFYAIFNPAIEKTSQKKETAEEGCLSVPRKYGLVPRHERVTLVGFDINGRKLKIRAWGLLARVFQHEIDHLDGKLFIDRATEVLDVSDERKRESPKI